jgi:hypothetical protein
MIVAHNISDLIENLRLQEDIKNANLMQSYVSHEMITPLKCLNELTSKVEQNLANGQMNNNYFRVID